MIGFQLTFPLLRVYAHCAFNKLKAGFSSLLDKRIPPLSGFFVSVIYLPFCFGWIFWGAERLAGLIPGLLTRLIRPPMSRMGGGSQPLNKRNANHEI